jgi:hypothetical protein
MQHESETELSDSASKEVNSKIFEGISQHHKNIANKFNAVEFRETAT